MKFKDDLKKCSEKKIVILRILHKKKFDEKF